jgi:two-component system response regulator FixJ
MLGFVLGSRPMHQNSAQEPRTVIVIEDDASLLSAMTFALRADGFDVLGYTDAADLLSAAPRRSTGCFVVDLRLPGLDGLALIAALRERGETAPAILITTDPDARHRSDAARAGVRIVEKPLLNSELRRSIDEAFATADRR